MKKNKFIILILFSLTLLLHASNQNRQVLFISHVSGVYNQDVSLNIEPLEPELEIRYAFTSETGWGPDLLCRESILLEALDGEERDYRLKISGFKKGKIVEERVLAFKIDKKKPLPPEIEVLEDYFPEEIILCFKSNQQDVVFYSLNTPVSIESQVWDGSIIVLTADKDEESQFSIQAFSKDKAGNRSEIKTFHYSLRQSKNSIKILSPSPGQFANRQMLFIHTKDIESIRYTLDGSDPMTGGREYNYPHMINFTGDLHLRVTGVPNGKSRKNINKSVKYQVIPEKQPSLVSDIQSGIYKRSLKVKITPKPGGDVFYTLNEKTPGEYDLPVPGVLSLDSLPSASKYSALRLKALFADGKWSREYRFFYIINRKKPQTPEITVSRKFPFTVEIKSHDNSEIYYTMDNSIPDKKSMAYKGPFLISPETAAKGRVIIKARSCNLSDLWGEIRTEEVHFDLKSPEPPEVNLTAKDNKPIHIYVSSPEGCKTIFEISSDNEKKPEISIHSQKVRDEMILSVPYGCEKSFVLRFASINDIDDAENISEIKHFTVHLDRQPPLCPNLNPISKDVSFDANLELTLDSESSIYYEISQDGTVPNDPTVLSAKYSQPISLCGIDESTVHYQIKLLCCDSIGNMSEIYGPFSYRIDLHKPESLQILGLENGTSYNSKEVRVSFNNITGPVFYVVTEDGSDPEDPDQSSTILSGNTLVFNGVKGQEKCFKLKYVQYSSDIKRAGDIKSFNFTIDLKHPDYPQINGFEDGKRYNKPVIVNITPADEGYSVYVSYSTSDSPPPDPVKHGELYKKPLEFDVEAGKEYEIRLRIANLDKAGNRAPGDMFAGFILDKKPPDDPKIKCYPGKDISRDAVTVSLNTEEGKIYYEVTRDGSIPQHPSVYSKLYQSPLMFTGNPNEEIIYKIVARAVDSLGNMSPGNNVYSLIIDRKSPRPPDKPRIDSIEKVFLISWEVPSGLTLFYKFKYGLNSSSEFAPYTAPVKINPEDYTNGISEIIFYSEDKAGNQSSLMSASVPKIKPKLPRPQIRGISQGSVYARRIELIFNSSDSETRVHYEISTDGTLPPKVSVSSSAADKPIYLDCSQGETLQFRIRARAFSINDNFLPSEELNINFVIDKTPPEAPVLYGMDGIDGRKGYFHENKKFSLIASDGKIYYTVLRNEEEPHIPDFREFKPYEKEIELKTANSMRQSFWIAALTVDDAGNRSPETRTWQIIIDKKVIYVSEKDGNDLYDGTRSRPFKSLSKAINSKSGRSLIYCASGIYAVGKNLVISDSLTIIGGLNPLTWEKESFLYSTIDTSRYFPEESALINLVHGRIHLEGFELSDSHDLSSALIESSSEEAFLNKVQFNILSSKRNPHALLLKSGSLKLTNCQFSAEKALKGTLLSVNGGNLTAAGCNFTGPEAGRQFTAIRLSRGSISSFSGIDLNPGTGESIKGFTAEDCELNLRNCTISSGQGRARTSGIELFNSRLIMIDCTLKGNPGGGYTTGLEADNSNIMIRQSRISVSGKYGTSGLTLRNSVLSMVGSTVECSDSSEFQYLVEIEKGRAYIANNILKGSLSGDSVIALLSDTQTDWFNNSLIGGTGRNLTAGLMIKGSNNNRIINNILIRKKGRSGIAVYRIGPEDSAFLLKANNLSGWQTLFSIESAPGNRKTHSIAYETIDRLNIHDGDYFGGSLHKNISESYESTFRISKQEDYHLVSTSKCVNGGIDLRKYNGPEVDMDGESRPAPFIGIKPAYDIGADELH